MLLVNRVPTCNLYKALNSILITSNIANSKGDLAFQRAQIFVINNGSHIVPRYIERVMLHKSHAYGF